MMTSLRLRGRDFSADCRRRQGFELRLQLVTAAERRVHAEQSR